MCVLVDGRLAVGYADGSICFIDIEAREVTTTFKAHRGRVSALCVLAHDQIASACSQMSEDIENMGPIDPDIKIWNVRTATQNGTLLYKVSPKDFPYPYVGPTTALCAVSNGRLGSGTDTDAVILWDVRKQVVETIFEGPQSMAFRRALNSAPGDIEWDILLERQRRKEVTVLSLLSKNRLVVGFSDGALALWDTEARAEIGRFGGHSDRIDALCTLSGDRIVSGARDNTIRVWESTTRTELARLEIDGPVSALAPLEGCNFVAGDSLGQLHWLEFVK
jgi:WD40 repeat protein